MPRFENITKFIIVSCLMICLVCSADQPIISPSSSNQQGQPHIFQKPTPPQGNDHLAQRDEYVQRKIAQAYNRDPLKPEIIESLDKVVPAELQTILNTLKNPDIRDHWPHFIILFGEPGVGKSTLGKYCPQKLGCPYLFFDAATIADEYQNSGAQNIDRIMQVIIEMAKQMPLLWVFWDEVNALADKGDKKKQVDQNTSMALWTAFDKLKELKNVITCVSTNDVESQRKQFISRAGCNIITVKPTYDDNYAFSLLLTCLNNQSLNTSRASLRQIAGRFKKLPPRAIEQIVNRAVHLANDRNKETVIVTMSDLLKAFNDYQRSQATANTWMKWMKSKIEKCNKYFVPLAGIVISLGSYWLARKSHLIARKSHQIAAQLFPGQKKQLDASNKIAPFQQKITENQAQNIAKDNELRDKNLILARNGVAMISVHNEAATIGLENARQDLEFKPESRMWTRVQGVATVANVAVSLLASPVKWMLGMG